MQGDDEFVLLSEPENESDNDDQDRLFDWSVEPSTPYGDEDDTPDFEGYGCNWRTALELAMLVASFAGDTAQTPFFSADLTFYWLADNIQFWAVFFSGDDNESAGTDNFLSKNEFLVTLSLILMFVPMTPGLFFGYFYLMRRWGRDTFDEDTLELEDDQQALERLGMTKLRQERLSIGLKFGVPITFFFAPDLVLGSLLETLCGVSRSLPVYVALKLIAGVSAYTSTVYIKLMTSDGKYKGTLSDPDARQAAYSKANAISAVFGGMFAVLFVRTPCDVALAAADSPFVVGVVAVLVGGSLWSGTYDTVIYTVLNEERALESPNNELAGLRRGNIVLQNLFRAGSSAYSTWTLSNTLLPGSRIAKGIVSFSIVCGGLNQCSKRPTLNFTVDEGEGIELQELMVGDEESQTQTNDPDAEPSSRFCY